MVFKNICFLVLWMKVTPALEGLTHYSWNSPVDLLIFLTMTWKLWMILQNILRKVVVASWNLEQVNTCVWGMWESCQWLVVSWWFSPHTSVSSTTYSWLVTIQPSYGSSGTNRNSKFLNPCGVFIDVLPMSLGVPPTYKINSTMYDSNHQPSRGISVWSPLFNLGVLVSLNLGVPVSGQLCQCG